MGVGLAVSYGTLGLQGLMFLLPRRVKPRVRRLFAGHINHFRIGGVQSFFDLEGNEMMYKMSKHFYVKFLPEVIVAASTKGPGMRQKYEEKVKQLLARPENIWQKGLSPEEAEALRKMYEERYNQ